MTRGVDHPAEVRAQAVAAVLAGTSIAQAARQYGLAKQTVARWVNETNGTDNAREIDVGELILDLLVSHVTAIQAQLQAATRPEWLEKQSAAELAELVDVERNTTIHLLAGLSDVINRDRPSVDAPALSETT